MALGGVFMTDTDGNIRSASSELSEKICGMLFDVSQQSSFPATKKDKVFALESPDDAATAGIDDTVIQGIPLHHINQYYDMVGTTVRAKLYVMFADCSSSWDALRLMQNAAGGQIGQFGIWTEQQLWTAATGEGDYGLSTIIGSINTKMAELANTYYAPASSILCPNTSRIGSGESVTTSIDLSKIPTCIATATRYVSVQIGQPATSAIQTMQGALTSTTPVGAMGLVLGCLYNAGVGESIGHVQNFDLVDWFPEQAIELGFGNATVASGKITDPTNYDTLTAAQLDDLDDNGFIFPMKYAGNNGVYFNADTTCSSGDYRTIARNRTINKSRRLVRANLLPFVNAPFKVDPTTGYLSSAQITIISNAAKSALNEMLNAEEVSAIGSVTVPANQNILENDKVILSYSLIPLGTAKEIRVTEGLAVTNA